MTVTRGFALSLICVLAAFMADTTGSAESPAAPTVHLRSITSRVHAKGASLVIEATEPAPYVTSRPDPLTVVLDFRGVDGEGLRELAIVGRRRTDCARRRRGDRPDGRPELARAHRPHAAGRS